MWTTLAQAISELRVALADNLTDKYAYQKKVFGQLDGSNTAFKTFERRRTTLFTDPIASAAPLGVYLNGTRLDPSTAFTYDNLAIGEYGLVTPPSEGDTLVSTYNYYWFLDSDLQQFLIYATQWLGYGTDPTKLADGLIPAALQYAGHEAFKRLSLWFNTEIANIYMLEGGPSKETLAIGASYDKSADTYLKSATLMRDDFYKRQGQSNAPLFGVAAGRIVDVEPRR